MNLIIFNRPVFSFFACVHSFFLLSTIHAEITLDGSIGPSGALTGPDFVIPADMGRQVNNNLFHSFGVFNINASESATFTGEGSIENVLARVTGGTSSNLDGKLRSTIPGADLFLINPAGIMFGPNAQLDVPGSFHASTANFVRLEDGVRFNAIPSADDALLTTAPPTAFGFLEENPIGIAVQESRLGVPEGETLSFVGGDLQITGGNLSALSGRIDIAAVESAGELVPSDTDLGVESFERLGAIVIEEDGFIDASGTAGGTIFVRGGELVMDNSAILANTLGDRSSAGIDVKVKSLNLTSGARISASTFGAGRGGDLQVVAENVFLSGEGADVFTGLTTQAQSDSFGDAGRLTVEAGRLEVREGAVISASTFGSGQGGNLLVKANSVLLSEKGDLGFAGIFSAAVRGGNAGDIRLEAGSLEVRGGAGIAASTLGSGQGGNLLVKADSVSLSGEGKPGLSGISSEAVGDGDAGGITLEAGSLEVRRGAEISASTFGAGRGGDLQVVAENVFLSGEGADVFTGLTTQAQSDSFGDAGRLTVEAGRLEVREGAVISASTIGAGNGGNLFVQADKVFLSGEGADSSTGLFVQAGPGNTGNAGDLTVDADSVFLDDGAISARSLSEAGKSGTIDILVHDTLRLQNGSSITVETQQANAGDINMNVGFMLHLRNKSSITASVAGGQGDGGNITADSVFVVLDSASEITANAQEGRGGNIRIVAENVLFISPDSVISASSELGIDGVELVSELRPDIVESLILLPSEFIDEAALLVLLQDPCVEDFEGGFSTLSIRSRDNLPTAPDDLKTHSILLK